MNLPRNRKFYALINFGSVDPREHIEVIYFDVSKRCFVVDKGPIGKRTDQGTIPVNVLQYLW